jgi:hypothetical protein
MGPALVQVRAGWLASLASLALVHSSFADECNATALDVALSAKASAAIGIETSQSGSGVETIPLAQCRFAPWPREIVPEGTGFELRCEKRKARNGKVIARASANWKASLVGVRVGVNGRKLFGSDSWPVEVLLTETTMGNLSLTATFADVRYRRRLFYSGVDLRESEAGAWDVEWAIGSGDQPKRGLVLHCSVRQTRN